MPNDTEVESPYDRFLADVKRISNVSSAIQVLQWDQEVIMPEGGAPARARQLSTLSTIEHETLTSGRMASTLGELKSLPLDTEQSANVREISRRFERMNRVPNHVIEEISRTSSEAFESWKKAKENSDFGTFEPDLRKLIELRQEYASHIDPASEPYEVLFADYEPYIDLDTVNRIFDSLRDALVPLIETIAEGDIDVRYDEFEGTFSESDQHEFTLEVLEVLGYDWDRGRLDTSPHPFSTGTQFDARITTRFDRSDPFGAVMSTIHEFGHANYTLGLPEEHYGTPLGEARDLTIHESQSRLWENHIGRSRPFWERMKQLVDEYDDSLANLSAESIYRGVNRVLDDNPIRVNADELTYHLHIILRYDIEKSLINDSMSIGSIPSVWNEYMDRYLDIRPKNDSRGCLQDIHWSHAAFGYFPTYTLGSVLAAQLYSAMEDEIPSIDEDIREGNFDPIRTWLREEIHQHGCRYPTSELIENATGKPLRADDFIDYVSKKYGRIYGL